MSRLWNADWPDDRSARETRAEFIERMRPYFPKPTDPHAEEDIARTRAALASANEYHMARDPRSMEVRLGYARMPSGMAGNGIWTAGDDGAVE